MFKKYCKIVVFLIIIVAIIVLDSIFGWSKYLSNTENLLFIRTAIDENYFFAVCIYIFVTIVGCVVLALPGITFAVLSGLLFGPFMGTVTCLIATTIGAMLSFLVGRFFLKDGIKPMLEKNKLLKRLLFSNDGKSDIIVLMVTRMIPIFPYNLQNFAYGVTDISFAKYSIYTFVFMLPGVALFTIGSAGFTASENGYMYFVVAIIIAIVVTIAGVFIKKKYLGNDNVSENVNDKG